VRFSDRESWTVHKVSILSLSIEDALFVDLVLFRFSLSLLEKYLGLVGAPILAKGDLSHIPGYHSFDQMHPVSLAVVPLFKLCIAWLFVRPLMPSYYCYKCDNI
jgi:hypothetical protein